MSQFDDKVQFSNAISVSTVRKRVWGILGKFQIHYALQIELQYNHVAENHKEFKTDYSFALEWQENMLQMRSN